MLVEHVHHTATNQKNLQTTYRVQWNPSYLGSLGPKGAHIYETARIFESAMFFIVLKTMLMSKV